MFIGASAGATPAHTPQTLAAGAAPVASAIEQQRRALKQDFARPGSIPWPDGAAPGAARTHLGRVLFFDPRLSASSIVSCATCHNPGFAWGDALPQAVGHGMKALTRRTPTVQNLAWSPLLFWDGRAGSLEEQALGPIGSPGEMNMPMPVLLDKLRAIPGYAPLFRAAFGDAAITPERIGSAIAAFERTVLSGTAPFDRWVAGDEAAIPASARRGFALFAGPAGCAKCHSGWRFTDDSFHDIGATGADPGRGALLPGIDSMSFAFKTPTLRNVNRRGPYLHDGSEPTLASVIELYDLGGRVRRPSLAMEVRPLHLTATDKQDLLDFLDTLTSADPPAAVPELPR